MKALIVFAGLGILVLAGGVGLMYRLMPVVAVAIALAVVGVLYETYLTAPSCSDGNVTFIVTKDLSSKYPDGALRTQNIRTLVGGLFASQRQCTMDVAPSFAVAGESTKVWTRISYSTVRSQSDKDQVRDVRVIGPVAQEAAAQ